MAAIWGFSPTYNDGYPYVMTAADLPEKSQEKPYPLYLWRRENGKNSGYPFFLLQPPPAPVPVLPVYQHEYITIYDMMTEKSDFASNGLAILRPSKCAITEVLNGEYSLTMTHPIDAEGRWKYIKEHNIIKACGQLFTIMQIEWHWTGRDSGEMTVFAEHIFYQLADPWIFPFDNGEQFTTTSCYLAIKEAMDRAYHHREPGQYIFGFEYYSDWEWDEPYILENRDGKTIIDVLCGSDGIIAAKGGELYRNNFYYSIMQTMENAKENAFDIRLGLNMCGITKNVDLSTFTTYFRVIDNFGGWWAWAWAPATFSNIQFPHHTIRSVNYEHDPDNYNFDILEQISLTEWRKNAWPVVCYEIDLIDVKRNPDYAEQNPNFEYKPGNTGRIYDSRLGGNITIRITETQTDAITGDVTKVTFGARRSFTRASDYPIIIDTEPEPVDIVVPVRDSDGVFCYDAEGVRILERIV